MTLDTLVTRAQSWTRAPIEHGVDGAGVYASRLRSRCSARGYQSPKVSGPKVGCLSDIGKGREWAYVRMLKGAELV